jgi:hypothetical protein
VVSKVSTNTYIRVSTSTGVRPIIYSPKPVDLFRDIVKYLLAWAKNMMTNCVICCTGTIIVNSRIMICLNQ